MVELRTFFFRPMRGLGSGHVTCGPMRGLEKNCTRWHRHTDTHTDKHTDGHGDSMTESAQWADSVKTKGFEILLGHGFRIQAVPAWPWYLVQKCVSLLIMFVRESGFVFSSSQAVPCMQSMQPRGPGFRPSFLAPSVAEPLELSL